MICMPDHSRIVIGVAGRIGSGKTAVAQELAASFGFEYFRYSLILAEWFGANPTDKERLQEIGDGVMSGEGQVELNRRLIGRIPPGQDSVVDGLRHPLDFDSLHREFGSRFSMIFVQTPREIRFERLRDRFADFGEFEVADSHPVESRIDDLKPMAAELIAGTLGKVELRAKLNSLVTVFRQRAEL